MSFSYQLVLTFNSSHSLTLFSLPVVRSPLSLLSLARSPSSLNHFSNSVSLLKLQAVRPNVGIFRLISPMTRDLAKKNCRKVVSKYKRARSLRCRQKTAIPTLPCNKRRERDEERSFGREPLAFHSLSHTDTDVICLFN